MFKIGDLAAQPGERVCGRIPVVNGLLPDGTRVEIPAIVVNGVESGPVFTVLAAVHGEEVTGSPAIMNVCRELDPGSMKGTLIGLPAANPLAFTTRTRGWVMDEPQALRNLNRVFPGKTDGTITERIAYTIFHEIVAKSTVILDFHTHWYGVPYVCYEPGFGGLSRKSFELADVAATKLVLREAIHHGTTHTEAPKRGIVSVNSETMGGFPLPVMEEHVKLWEKTMMNMLGKLDMIDRRPEYPEHIYAEHAQEASNLLLGRLGSGPGPTTIRPVRNGGFMMPLVKLMEKVSSGQRLATIVNLFGEEVDAIYSPCDEGIIVSMRHNVVQPGETPIEIAHIVSREEMLND